jgi:hypothetical protein
LEQPDEMGGRRLVGISFIFYSVSKI